MTAESRRAEDAAELAGFGQQTLVWHAALPEWTDELATRLHFPVGDHGTVEALVEALGAFGLAQHRTELRPDGTLGLAFWMPSSRRGDVGGHLRHLGDVFGCVQDLHRSLSDSTDLPPAAAALLRILDGNYLEPTGVALLSDVDDLLAASRAVDATRLVGAAQCLGDVVGDPLAASSRRAEWRLRRAYRQADDARALRYYQPRADVEDILADLIRGEDRWALHLRGDAGVGKTMLLRCLASPDFADRHDLPPTVFARVDFDHLDPRYPSTRPAELLLALADDLFGFTGSRGSRSRRRRFDDAAFHLHELTQSGNPPADAVEHALQSALETFALYLRELGPRVVLVLDTCEELVKLHAPGTMSPAVERTIALLTGLRSRFDGVRAVFAGRRWFGPPRGRPFLHEFAARLRTVELDGFTVEEAAGYVARRDTDLVIRPDVRDAILVRCTAPTGIVNPFDLSSYVEWAVEDPSVSRATLLSAPGDPYVEQRILGRLAALVRAALPIACELGRFNQEMLTAELRRRRLDPAAVFEELADQEWARPLTFDTDGRPRIVEIDPNLLPRLRAVLATRSPLDAQDRLRLGQAIAELCFEGPIEEVSAEVLEAALRLLPVPSAAAWWARLDARILEQRAWGWAAQILPRAVVAVPPGPASVRAAVRATQAAATLRLPGQPGVAALWEDVHAWASEHPDPASGEVLRARAVCGRLASDPSATLHAGDMKHLRRHAPVDALVAAGEALLLRDAVTSLDTIASLLAARVPETPRSGLDAAAALVVAGVSMRFERYADARRRIDRALQAFASTGEIGCTDWLGIARPRDRARLARVRLAIATFEPLSAIPSRQWEDGSAELDDIDAERLASALTEHRLDWELPDRRLIGYTFRSARPTSVWHRLTPPLFVTAARLLTAFGDYDQAADLLRERRELAIADGEDAATVRECDFALVALCRRARSTMPTTSLHRLVKDPDPMMRAAAWPALCLATGARPGNPGEAGSPHSFWELGGVPVTLTVPVEHLAPGPAGAALVDLLEAGWPTGGEEPLRSWRQTLDKGSVPRDFTADPTGAALGAMLRLDLTGDGTREGGFRRDWQRSAPPRRIAVAALAEGELVALRRPRAGIRLLAEAESLFAQAGDGLGTAHARILAGLARFRCGEPFRAADVRLPHLSRQPVMNAWSQLYGAYHRIEHGLPLDPVDGQRLPELDLPTGSAGRPATRGVDPGELRARDVLLRAGDRWRVGTIHSGPDRIVFPAVPAFGGQWTTERPSPVGTSVIPILLDDIADPYSWERDVTDDPGAKDPAPVRFQAADQNASHLVRWKAAGHPFETRHLGEFGDFMPPTPGTLRLTVQYVVGVSVDTRGGPRMRVRTERRSAESYSGRSVTDGERLFAADQLQLKGTALAVLQCEPTDARAEPLGELRSVMLAFAGDILASGADAVLIIPGLPDRDAADAVRRVYAAAERTLTDPTGPAVLFDLVRELRRLARGARDDVMLMFAATPTNL